MTTLSANLVLRHIRGLVTAKTNDGLSDGQLLQRYTAEHDEAAFGELVRRHGPLVLGVCRRVLHNHHDAEDAFQATFLVLARRAASISPEAVGCWLHRVAYHAALKARLRLTARQRRERQARSSASAADPLVDVTARELVTVLDEELQRLPERQRSPLVLCYLEGKTRDEAAQQLGWSLGTLKRRLEQGREYLRARLARRGLTWAAVLAAAGIGQKAMAGGIPAGFVASTVRAVLQAAGSGTNLSESVATLADGVMKALLLPKSKFLATGVLLLAGLLALGIGAFTHPASARLQGGDTAAVAPAPSDVKEPAKNDLVKPADQKDLTVTGRVLDPDGKPVSKADVALVASQKPPLRGQERISWPKVVAQASTDAEGRFRLTVPGRSRDAFWNPSVVARAPGYALGQGRLDPDNEQKEVEIRLNQEQAVRGRLVDIQGQPAAGVKVHVITVSARLSPKKYLYVDLQEPPQGVKAWPAAVTTDAKGRFVLHGLRPDWEITVAVREENLARQDLPIKAQDKDKAEEVTLALAPVRIIEGTVTYEDTGKPVPNARVMVLASKEQYGSRGYQSYWPTDAKGRFRAVPHSGNHFSLIAYPPAGEPYLLLRREFNWPKTAVVKHTVDFKLVRGVVVRGTVRDTSGKPIAGAPVEFEPRYDDNPFYRDDVRPLDRGYDPELLSGADGKFAITVLPGPGHLLINGPTLDYLHDEILTKKLYGSGVRPQRRHYADAIVELNSKPGADLKELTVKLRSGVTVSGKLLTPDGKPVAKAALLCQSYIPHGHELHQVMALPAGKGAFELRGYNPDKPLPVYFLDAENQLGAMVKFSGKDVEGKASVKLQPCGSATARFLDAKGKPLANVKTFLMMALNDGLSFFDSLTKEGVVADEEQMSNLDFKRYQKLKTDEKGRVTFPTLIPGARFMIIVVTPGGRYVHVPNDFTVEAGKTRDLKDITVKEPQ
jgi:RNA polymerase sigma factor (sigma-70 family)